MTLARYTWCASVSLALGGTSRWKALWSNQKRVEKQWREKSVYDLKFQWDNYLQEIEITSTFLSRYRMLCFPLTSQVLFSTKIPIW